MSNDLGIDRSGNNNNWTVNNITSADQMLDSPTNNFCTFNPLNHGDPGSKIGTLSEGNLKMYYNEAGTALCLGTMAPTSGKWYCEFTYDHGNAASDRTAVGIGQPENVTITGNGNAEKMVAATTIAGSGLNRVWLTDNVEGRLIRPKKIIKSSMPMEKVIIDTSHLAEIMIDYIEHPKKIKEQSHNARKRIEKDFNWDHRDKQILDLLLN